MRIDIYKQPESSFFSVEKDLNILLNKFLEDKVLKRLLWYTTKTPLKLTDKQPDLTEEESLSLLGDYIKITPKTQIDAEVLNYITISFDGFTTNGNNPQFRDNSIIFDIVCHYDQWQLEDLQLRPYRIAAQIDTIMKNVKLTNMGKANFKSALQVVVNDEFAGLCIVYDVIHGGEDSKTVMGYGEDESRDEAQEAMVSAFKELFKQNS